MTSFSVNAEDLRETHIYWGEHNSQDKTPDFLSSFWVNTSPSLIMNFIRIKLFPYFWPKFEANFNQTLNRMDSGQVHSVIPVSFAGA